MSDWRRRVVDEARSWVLTPYHHAQRVKGAGVDCAMLLAEVYARAGCIPKLDPPPYSIDWFKHRNEEVFKGWVERFARPLEWGEKIQPADLLLTKYGRCYSHGAVVVAWPKVIHALRSAAIVTLDDLDPAALHERSPLFYTLKEEYVK